MTKYRIVSKGGKFYIQYLRQAGLFRKRREWSYVCSKVDWAGSMRVGGEPIPWDTQEAAEETVARYMKEDHKSAEPFRVVKEF